MITLYHVSNKERTSLVCKAATQRDHSIDVKAVYLSLNIKQAVWWSDTLSQTRKVSFSYFYQIEVSEENLYERKGNKLTLWTGRKLDEVLYIGNPITNLVKVTPDISKIRRELLQDYRESFW
jgi:hypothetical protein